ncbi:MAG: tetratricopeptide repeat protein [Acidobacteria bacterium]|nr:tetratricopeptide repeat protein [Acidobacteriota bacterium]
MRLCVIQLTLVCFGSAVGVSAQQTPTPVTPPPAVRSHVERFSSPQVRAERTEADATSKLTAHPNDPELLNTRAYARMSLGRYKEAYEDLLRAVALKPMSAEYQAGLGYTLWKIGRHTEAVEAERKAVKLDEKNFTALYQLGRFLLFTGGSNKQQLEEAAAHLRRALEVDPRHSEVRFDLLTAYRELGDAAQALGQLKLLEDARPSDPRVIYIAALLASDRGDLSAALNGFREALRLDPTLLGAWQDLGLANIKLGRWSDAIETFAELVKRQPDSVEAAYFYALSLFNAGRVQDAENAARRALRLDAGTSAAHTLLGIILASRGGADTEATESLSQAVALDPQSFDAHFYLGRVQYAVSDFTAAVKSLRAAVGLNPKHAEARFFLGTVLEAAGESDAALIEYQRLTEIDPQSAIGQVGLGALQVKQGKIGDAIVTLKRAVALDRKIFEAHWALGRALALNERFPEAIESLKAAVTLMPERVDAHYQLGLALRRTGRSEEAKSEFAVVERLNAEFRARTK